MWRRRALPAVVALAGGAATIGTARAQDVFTMPLPEVIGSYEPGDALTVACDCGTDFVRVDDVHIQWSGVIWSGLGHGDGIDLPPNVWFAWEAQLAAEMNGAESGGWSAYVGPVHGAFDVEQPFEPLESPTWDFLLDGQLQLSVHLAPAEIAGGVMMMPPVGSVYEAQLIVEGVLPGPGDIDHDGHVGFADLIDLLMVWGACPEPPARCRADLDASGDVGMEDLMALLENWG